jgi:choline dehydrogenase
MTYDYIIIGAGSAGCVLANRSTAGGRYRVLLLEAGPRDTNPWIHVPLGYGKLFATPSVNWMYQSEPEPELNCRSVFTPRGKVRLHTLASPGRDSLGRCPLTTWSCA